MKIAAYATWLIQVCRARWRDLALCRQVRNRASAFAEDVYHTIKALQQPGETLRATITSPEQAQKVLLEACEAIRVSLEALYVAAEALLLHNELTVARQAAQVWHTRS